jgi:uncharacterized protein YebE (UPF0316 family)
MIKFILVFVLGTIETFLYTAWCLSANRKQVYRSSILMFIYMVLYLGLIAFAIKDTNTIGLIITYALSCGLGNYLELLWEKR